MHVTALDRMSADEARRWDADWRRDRRYPSARWTWSPVSQMKNRLRQRLSRQRRRRSPATARRYSLRWQWREERREAALFGHACLHCQPAPRACPLHGHPEDIPF